LLRLSEWRFAIHRSAAMQVRSDAQHFLVPSISLFFERGLTSLPTTLRCKMASAGNGDFNTSRIYVQPSRGPVKGSKG